MVTKYSLLAGWLAFSPALSFSQHVTNVEIDKTGIAYQGRSEVEHEGCKLFQPTREQLVNYFNRAARREEDGRPGHQYYSPCIVAGKVTFTNGDSGRFTLQSSGFGYATFNHKEVHFFHKDNPWFDPFQCTYAMGDEVEPGCD